MTRHGKEWPSTEMEMDAGAIAAEYVRRATTSSGLYQMHTELFDVVVLNHPVEGKATYYYEVPGSFCMPGMSTPPVLAGVGWPGRSSLTSIVCRSMQITLSLWGCLQTLRTPPTNH
eukprot:scaffold237_cov421-Prasinococcus_capsulatus_cf.AAC.7